MASGDSSGSVILVDAHSLVFQSFHAIPAMTSPDGRPVNALFGFTRDLFFIRDELKPDEYPHINHNLSVEDPAQAWNVITVGAHTEKVMIEDPDGLKIELVQAPGDPETPPQV